MVNLGTPGTRLMGDGWTVKTRDRSLSAQWEHTLAVTETGVEVLTAHPGDDENDVALKLGAAPYPHGKIQFD